MYGASFQRLFPDDESLRTWRETWGAGLAGLAGEQIARGLAKCLTESPRWAPSLGEFRELCEGPRPSNRPEHQRYVALPPPPIDLEQVDRRIAEAVAFFRPQQGAGIDWVLKVRTQEAVNLIARDPQCAHLVEHMRAHGVIDAAGNLVERRA